ncbi:MAG: acyl-CoA dehydrogenase family protein [Sphingomicrobium sp.]
MDFTFTDDQRQLAEGIDRLFREQANGTSGASLWKALIDMGLTMLPFAREDGGLGLGGVEVMIAGKAFGRYLVAEPYLSSIILAGTAFRFGADDQQRLALLPGLIGGDTVAALAHVGAIEARPSAEEWTLSGEARLVLGGDRATMFVIPAGDALFVVPRDAVGLQARAYPLHGGGGAADLHLDQVKVGAEARLDAKQALSRSIEAGIGFLAAEASGAAEAALELTVEHLKTREQFGRPIGQNQALQHRAAEMLVEVEQLRSAAIYAALLWTEADDAVRSRGYAAVKAVVGKSGRFVAQQAVHLHGGLGVSEEHRVSHYFRRLTAIGLLLGETASQVRRLTELGGFTGPEPHWSRAV